MNDCIKDICLEMFADSGKESSSSFTFWGIMAQWFLKPPNDMENQLIE